MRDVGGLPPPQRNMQWSCLIRKLIRHLRLFILSPPMFNRAENVTTREVKLRIVGQQWIAVDVILREKRSIPKLNIAGKGDPCDLSLSILSFFLGAGGGF